jgi:hypothetical protein
MKKILLAALIGACAFSANAANVGVSVNIGDPNFYGAIDIGNYPPPQLVNPAPVIIQPGVTVGVAVAPLYLHVPAAHYGNWRRYCGMYNACGRPVYFVHDNWYRQVYAPRYIHEHPMHQEVRHEEIRHEEIKHAEERHEEHHDHHEDGR